MLYPKFYDEIEKIKIKDELSDTLGAFKDGIIEFSYLDVVKSAGHSCPTIAGAYLMLKEGLKVFNDPKRGEIEAYLNEDIDEGVTGVISNVIVQVTGATHRSGFHGLLGRFDRRKLLHFNASIDSSMRLKDKSGKVVDIIYNSSSIPQRDHNMHNIMQKVLSQSANQEEEKKFKELWQERVAEILRSPDLVISKKVTETAN